MQDKIFLLLRSGKLHPLLAIIFLFLPEFLTECRKAVIVNSRRQTERFAKLRNMCICLGADVMNSKIRDEYTDNLFKAILQLRTIEECYKFFEDICTISEIKALSQRLEVAKMLRQKKTYTEISEKTGASTATISRVNRCLIYGADGYNMILDRLETE